MLMKNILNKDNLKDFANQNSAFIAFMGLFMLAVITCGTTFLNIGNLMNILRNNSIIGILSLGMTLVIINGSIDLSVGSQLALTALIALSIINSTQSIILGIILSLISAVVFGFITGWLVAKFNVPAFIVTLGTMTIYRSLSQYFFDGGGLLVSGKSAKAFISISNMNLFGVIPLPIIFWLILAFIISFFMSNTPTGRYIYAVGSNEKATRLSGININRVKVYTFIISGIFVSISGIVEASRLGSINSASSGISYEMDAITSVVIGGTSMSGGRGKIIGTVFGTLTLGVINNMMNLFGVPPFLVGAVKGVIIIFAVLFQKRLNIKEND